MEPEFISNGGGVMIMFLQLRERESGGDVTDWSTGQNMMEMSNEGGS